MATKTIHEIMLIGKDQASNPIHEVKVNLDGVNESARIASESIENMGNDIAEKFGRSVSKIQDLNKNLQVTGSGNTVAAIGNGAAVAAPQFNMLNASIQQVTRELPSLTMGANMFFLAISNNLPVLADSIKMAKTQNNALTASGKKATPVWKQVASSLFSWQTALVVGVTVLASYGDEIVAFISNMIKGKSAADQMATAQKQVNDTFMDGSGIGKAIVQYKTLQSGWNALGDNLAAKQRYIEENKKGFDDLGKSIGSVNDAEKFLNNQTTNVITALQQRAKAAAAMKLASEAYEKALKLQIKNEKEASSNNGPSGTDKLRSYMATVALQGTGVDAQTPKQIQEARIAKNNEEEKSAFALADSYFTLGRKFQQASAKVLDGGSSVSKAATTIAAASKAATAVNKTTTETITHKVDVSAISGSTTTVDAFDSISKLEAHKQSLMQDFSHSTDVVMMRQITQEIKAIDQRISVLKSLGSGGTGVTDTSDLNAITEKNDASWKTPVGKEEIKTNNKYADSLNAISQALNGVSQAASGGAAAWLSWGANVLAAVAAAIPAILMLTMSEEAKAAASAKSAAFGAMSAYANIPVIGPILGIAAMASVVAAMLAIPKFAAGGLAYGPTLGMFGEYAGASNNPEVIAPLDKLRSLIQPSGIADGMEFRIRGTDLVAVTNKVNHIQARTR